MKFRESLNRRAHAHRERRRWKLTQRASNRRVIHLRRNRKRFARVRDRAARVWPGAFEFADDVGNVNRLAVQIENVSAFQIRHRGTNENFSRVVHVWKIRASTEANMKWSPDNGGFHCFRRV